MNPNSNNENNKELIEALKTEEDEVVETKEKSVFGLQMKKIIFFLILITVLLFIILWLLSLSSSKKTEDYSAYEKKMVAAAKKYYEVNKNMLPTENNKTSEVELSKLIELKYMENYTKLKSCTGSVTVENNSGTYNYTSYLDCGDSKSKKLLFNKITSSNNIVTENAGLYSMNNEYIYRGEKVNNYVKFSGRIWRIVKVDVNGDIVLVLDKTYQSSYPWDDRYNSDVQNNYGYNDYTKSRIKEFLDDVYNNSKNNTDNEYVLLTKKAAKKLKSFKLCIGKVDPNQTLNNNTYECSTVLENTKIGLLTVSDYITASIDPSCNSVMSDSCQNYNYLSDLVTTWWLATGNSNNNYEVYSVFFNQIEIKKAVSTASIRPVIHLRKNTAYTSGNGSENKPFVIE